MKCGHVAQGYDSDMNPVCVICLGISDDATIISDKKSISLAGRIAVCTDCFEEKPSDFNLPFFRYCGENSVTSKLCKNCGRSEQAHVNDLACSNYEPKGDTGKDFYYCGCKGWG